MKKILQQLAREIWIPLVVAGLWTTYNLYSENSTDPLLKRMVNIFGPSFFLVSWAVSQWYRINKQQKVESNLSTIEERIKETLRAVETRTAELLGHLTGGDSICGLAVSPDAAPEKQGSIFHCGGRHTLQDIRVEVWDTDEYDPQRTRLAAPKQGFLIKELRVGWAEPIPIQLALNGRDRARFRIHFSARNGEFLQFLNLAKINGRWLVALMVQRNDCPYYERVDADFPRGVFGQVEW